MTTRSVLLSLAAVQVLAAAQIYYPPPDAKGGWRTLKDKTEILKTAGLDAGKLDEAFNYVQQTSQHGGLLVVRHGYLVYEKYFGRGNREALPELASCGKAFQYRRGYYVERETRSHPGWSRSESIYAEVHAG